MKLLKLVPDHTNIDFMRWRNVAVVVSSLATIASLIFTAYRGLNLGIDFVGGQLVRVEFAQPVHIEDLRARVDRMGVGEASIQALGTDKAYQIRLAKPGGPEAAANRVVSTLRAQIPAQFPGARVDSGESPASDTSSSTIRHVMPAMSLDLSVTVTTRTAGRSSLVP